MNIRRNLVANLTGQGWSAVLNLAAVPIYIALLGVESFGLIGLAAVVTVLASLLDGGMAPTLNQAMVHFRAGKATQQHARDMLRSAEILLGFGVIVLALGAVLLGPKLATVWLEPDDLPIETVGHALTLMILIALLRVSEAIYRGTLLGLNRPVLMNSISVVAAAARVLGPVPLIVYFGGDIMTFFKVQLVAGILSLACFAFAAHHILGSGGGQAGRFNRSVVAGTLRFSGGALAVAGLSAIINQSDKLLVAQLGSLEVVGFYSAATVIATGIYQLVLPTFQSFYPSLSHHHANSDDYNFNRVYLRTAATIGFIAGAPIAVLLILAHDVLFAWTGHQAVADRSEHVLQFMCAGVLANGLFHAPLAGLLAAKRPRLAVISSLALVLVLLPILLLGWKLGGPPGIAAAWSAGMIIWYAAILASTKRAILTSISSLRVLLASVGPFVVAFAFANLAALLPRFGSGRIELILWIIVFSAFVAAATFAVCWAGKRLVEPIEGNSLSPL